jgi:hypothetical protein
MSVGIRMTGSVRPENPELGDCYFEPSDGTAWIWMGGWMRLVSTSDEYQGIYVIEEEP